MVKTKVRKSQTFDAVRGVKSHIGELISQIKQGQKWKKKYKKLKKKIAKFESKKVITKITTREKRIYDFGTSMLKILGLNDIELVFRMYSAAAITAKCPELMSRHAKTIAAGVIHTYSKPQLNKKFMQEKIGVSIPTIGKVSKIIKNL